MEMVHFSETLVSTYKFTWLYNPEQQQQQKLNTLLCLTNHSLTFAFEKLSLAMDINFCRVSPTELYCDSDVVSPSTSTCSGIMFRAVSGGTSSHQYSICSFESLPN
jgi:hypothetical protein